MKKFFRDPMGMLTWIPILASLIMFVFDLFGCFDLRWYWIWLPAMFAGALWTFFIIVGGISAIRWRRK